MHQYTGEVAGPHRFYNPLLREVAQRHELQQLLASPGAAADAPEHAGLRLAVGTAEALYKCRHAFRRFVQHDGVHISDVNAQFQGAGGDTQGLRPALELAFDLLALARFEVAVMQVGSLLKRAMVAQQGEESVAAAAAVSE